MNWVSKYRVTIGFFLGALAFGFVVYTIAYNNAHNRYVSNLAGCERVKLDRADNAEGWLAARNTRLRQAKLDTNAADRANDLRAAEKYDTIAASLESRIKPCTVLVTQEPRWLFWTPDF
jgi:hypothetical protein